MLLRAGSLAYLSTAAVVHRTASLVAQVQVQGGFFAEYQGKCVAQSATLDRPVSSEEEAAQIIGSDPASHPAYLLRTEPDGASSVWLCGGNYAAETFDADPDWILCVFQAQEGGYTGQPYGGSYGDTDAELRRRLAESGGSLDLDSYRRFVQDNEGEISEDELRRRFAELDTYATQAYEDGRDQYGGTYPEYAASYNEGREEYASTGGAYNYAAQQTRELTPLLEFLRWQEWYVNYCKLRNINN